MTSTRDIVHKLWNLCHVLRDDGITYQDYVTELTWLLGCTIGMGLLERAHAYKDRTAQGQATDHGLFAYPVLQAADQMRRRLLPGLEYSGRILSRSSSKCAMSRNQKVSLVVMASMIPLRRRGLRSVRN